MNSKPHPIPIPVSNLIVPAGTKSPARLVASGASANRSLGAPGLLIINADDWGRDQKTTDRTLECKVRGSVSSVSAMVFMEDSERAAVIARERGIDAGLHLNFTTSFSALDCSEQLRERQRELAKCLLHHRFSQALFYPALVQSFKYVVSAQLDEFCRLYGAAPRRIDGHHHMHLCANVRVGKLLPAGVIVRRNFSVRRGEKNLANRLYRQVVDRALARRHPLTDFFSSLPPLDPPSRLEAIMSLARKFTVEVETHPIDPEEYKFLAGGEIFRLAGGVPVSPRYLVKGWPGVK